MSGLRKTPWDPMAAHGPLLERIWPSTGSMWPPLGPRKGIQDLSPRRGPGPGPQQEALRLGTMQDRGRTLRKGLQDLAPVKQV